MTDVQPGAAAGASGGGTGSSKTVGSRPGEKFSGLAIEDTRDRAKQLQDELVAEGLARAGVTADADASTSYGGGTDGKRGRDGERERGREDRDGKRSRQRSRSRDRDGDRRRDSDRYRDHDRGRDREGRDGKRGASPEGRSNRMAPPPATMMPDSAEQHGIYRAVISNVMDFGAFCELQVYNPTPPLPSPPMSHPHKFGHPKDSQNLRRNIKSTADPELNVTWALHMMSPFSMCGASDAISSSFKGCCIF